MGVVACVAALSAWHLAHSAVPASPVLVARFLVGHQTEDSMRSSVVSEISVFAAGFADWLLSFPPWIRKAALARKRMAQVERRRAGMSQVRPSRSYASKAAPRGAGLHIRT